MTERPHTDAWRENMRQRMGRAGLDSERLADLAGCLDGDDVFEAVFGDDMPTLECAGAIEAGIRKAEETIEASRVRSRRSAEIHYHPTRRPPRFDVHLRGGGVRTIQACDSYDEASRVAKAWKE